MFHRHSSIAVSDNAEVVNRLGASGNGGPGERLIDGAVFVPLTRRFAAPSPFGRGIRPPPTCHPGHASAYSDGKTGKTSSTAPRPSPGRRPCDSALLRENFSEGSKRMLPDQFLQREWCQRLADANSRKRRRADAGRTPHWMFPGYRPAPSHFPALEHYPASRRLRVSLELHRKDAECS